MSGYCISYYHPQSENITFKIAFFSRNHSGHKPLHIQLKELNETSAVIPAAVYSGTTNDKNPNINLSHD